MIKKKMNYLKVIQEKIERNLFTLVLIKLIIDINVSAIGFHYKNYLLGIAFAFYALWMLGLLLLMLRNKRYDKNYLDN